MEKREHTTPNGLSHVKKEANCTMRTRALEANEQPVRSRSKRICRVLAQKGAHRSKGFGTWRKGASRSRVPNSSI